MEDAKKILESNEMNVTEEIIVSMQNNLSSMQIFLYKIVCNIKL